MAEGAAETVPAAKAIAAFAAIGVACDLLVQAGSLAGPGGARLFPMGGALRAAAALGYQLGVLIFPTVVPVLLWGMQVAKEMLPGPIR